MGNNLYLQIVCTYIISSGRLYMPIPIYIFNYMGASVSAIVCIKLLSLG